jgi:SAM-dependent methyltransferase
VGDLASGLARGAVTPGAFDLVVAQFVLEHLEDPGAEIALVAQALAPGGHAALIVPSAEAVEAQVFGGAYRSLRGDHLHYFSRRSLGILVERAGLGIAAAWTECNVHLLLGFLSAEELARDVYGAGLGPDLTLLARKPA